MRFKTSLMLAENKVFGIELDLAQMPSVFYGNESFEQLDILGSIYEIREIVFCDGGKVKIIAHCKYPKKDGRFYDFILLEHNPIKDGLLKFSLKTNRLPHNGIMPFSLFRIPKSKDEYVEKEGIVFKVNKTILSDDNVCSGESNEFQKSDDFYKRLQYPYNSI